MQEHEQAQQLMPQLLSALQQINNQLLAQQQQLNALARMVYASNEVLFTPPLQPLEEYAVPTRPLVELAVVAVARNEGPYFREWLEYHRLMGVFSKIGVYRI